MQHGQLVGRTELTQRPSERPGATRYVAPPSIEIASFHTASTVSVTALSRVYEVLYGGSNLNVIANLTDANGIPTTLTGATTIDVLVNGVSVGTVTVASGDSRGETTIAQATSPGDLVTLETTAVGTGTAYGTTQIHVRV